MRAITKIIVHCSDSPDDQDIGFQEINQWHLMRGWKSPSGISCGYHFIIRRNGTVELGRMVNEVGAHVQGANLDSIGICLIGRQNFSDPQFISMKRIIGGLLEEFPESIIYGHREFPSAKAQGKTCPNFDVHQVLENQSNNENGSQK